MKTLHVMSHDYPNTWHNEGELIQKESEARLGHIARPCVNDSPPIKPSQRISKVVLSLHKGTKIPNSRVQG